MIPSAAPHPMSSSHTCCRRQATPVGFSAAVRLAVALLALAAIVAGPVHVQATQPRPEAGGGAGDQARRGAAASDPTPGETMNAYRTMRLWIDGWGLPSVPGPGDLPASVGAAVLLRFEGQIVGRAVEMPAEAMLAASDRDGRGSPAAFRALQAAFAEADRRVPLPHDATRAQLAGTVGKRVTISLELAGAPTPVDVPTFAELDLALAPGIDGVLVRQGSRCAAMSPAMMLAANLTPSEAARSLVAQVAGDAALALQEVEALRTRSKIGVLRFRVVHLAQGAPEAQPAFLTRGQELVPITGMNAGSITAMAESLALTLTTRLHDDTDGDDEPLGLRGSYLPWAGGTRGGHATAGRFEPAFAPPREQALAAVALAAAARAPGLGERIRARSGEAAQRLLHDLADVTVDEIAPWTSPAAAALTLLALRATDGAGPPGEAEGPAVWRTDLHDRCYGALASVFDAKTGLFAPATEGQEGLLALALVREGSPVAAGAVGAAFERSIAGRLVSHMPWLGWACAEVQGVPEPVRAGWVARLREMRGQLWANQVRAHEADTELADMAGGIVFSTSQRALPTWQCLRPLVFAASAWHDAALTPDAERPAELAALLWATRYARQLQAQAGTGWMQVSPPVARGGVRAAMWDQTQPPDATSLALLLAVEMRANIGGPNR